MRAIVFDLRLAKLALAKGLGRFLPQLYYGPGSCLGLREVAPPSLPGPDWAAIQVEMAGVCGSDLALITLHSSPALSPFNSFPAVLGHEIYGRVAAAGARSGVREGDRVAIDPLLGCAVRGFQPPCAACARGEAGLCARMTDGALGAGMMLGFCKALPGGWSERLVAHKTQLVPVPNAISDEAAVLLEPLSVGLHAVLRRTPRAEEKVLVIGGGPVSCAVLCGLALVENQAEITNLALLPYQAELARRLGAHRAITPADGPVDDQVEKITGASRKKAILGPPTFVGGFDLVYDCVGTEQSLSSALRYVRPGGTLVLIGCAAVLRKIDLTMVWAHELTILGSYTYGLERPQGRRTFEITAERIAGGRVPVEALVTHRFALEQYREAIVANLDRAGHRSVKAVFDNRQGAPAIRPSA